MKKSELKKQIREEILSTLMEKKKKEEETPEVEIKDEETEEVPEIPAEDNITSDDFGVDPKITKLQSALKAAYDAAKEMNDEKLVTQIGNTITYFTRAHIVTDEKPNLAELKKYINEIIKQNI